MKIFKLEDMTKGWFIGNFSPTAFNTDLFEVNYRTHQRVKNGNIIIIQSLRKLI